MGSGAKSSTTTKKQVIAENKARLDKLTTREAQVLRMRFGISEPLDAAVGSAHVSNKNLRDRLLALEGEVIQRAKGEDQDDAKGKIISILQKKKS